MKANHQLSTGDVARANFKHRRFLSASGKGWHSLGWKPRSQLVLLIAIVGTVLFLWTPPAAAASTITEFHASNVGVPQGITISSDGNLWFTDRARLIVKMTPAGQFTSFKIPTSNAATDDITTGPDGNLWFTEAVGNIGRITTS